MTKLSLLVEKRQSLRYQKLYTASNAVDRREFVRYERRLLLVRWQSAARIDTIQSLHGERLRLEQFAEQMQRDSETYIRLLEEVSKGR